MVDRQLGPLYAGQRDFRLLINLPDRYQRRWLADWEFSRAVVSKAKRKKAP